MNIGRCETCGDTKRCGVDSCGFEPVDVDDEQFQEDPVVILPKGPAVLPTGDVAAVAAANAVHKTLAEVKKALTEAGVKFK